MSYLNDEQNITSWMNFICFSSNTPTGEHKYMVRFKLMNWSGTQQATFDILVV